MTKDIERLEKRIDELAERLRRIEMRLATGGNAALDADAIEDDDAVDEAARGERVPATVIVSLVGRSLIVLGGAFLLRWLTQSGVLPQKLGSVVGMFYALLWVVMADRAAGRGRRPSAAFHGITSTLIVFPLLVEVTTKSHYLTPMLSAIHLLAFIILGLAVAWRRNLRVLAWIVTMPAAPLAFLLSVETSATTPFLVSLLILGFATLWLGYLRHWHGLATVMAGVVNLGLAMMVMDYVAVSERVGSDPDAALWEVLFLLFGLVALYFGSYCYRVFSRKRTITPIEIGNTLFVVLVGLGGGALVIDASKHSMLPLGIVCVILSVASYTAAYGFLPRRDPNRRNFLFYTLIALAMAVLGLEILMRPPAAAVAFAAIALIAGALAKRVSSPILYLHGAAYLIAAIMRSGLVAVTKSGLVGGRTDLAEWLVVPVLFALAVTALYPWFPKPPGRVTDMVLGRRATDLFLLVAVLALSGLCVALVARLSPQGDGSETHRGLLACARTGALALSAALLAWYNPRSRFGRLTWLVYTLLAVGAVKFVFEDIRAGGAAALFFSLALYGGALILAPRLLHGAGKQEAAES